jgi:hypothetical protein
MRGIHHILLAIMATSATASSWSSLPTPPDGRVASISGNGKRILAVNTAGGASWREGEGPWTRSLEAPGWEARMEGDLEVRTLDRVRALDMRTEVVLYARPGDTVWNSAWMGGAVDFVSVSTDGRRMAAVARSASGGRQVLVETDSVVSPIPDERAGEPPRNWRAWKALVPPDVPSEKMLSGAVRCWIAGNVLLVLSGEATWRSPDLGRSWDLVDLPPFAEVAVAGDTIVARTGDGTGSLHVSVDGGSTWNLSTRVDREGPWDLRLAGGMLWGRFQRELARSTNLGRTWTTFRNLSPEGGVAWDGRSFWTTQVGAPLRWEPGNGWIRQEIPESRIRKLRTLGSALLALQGVGDPANRAWESKRLVAWENGTWRALRDSVFDLEVLPAGDGLPERAVVVSGWGSGISHVLQLSSSTDLRTWTVDTRVKPYIGRLGRSGPDLLVGAADSLYRVVSTGKVQGIKAWSQSEAPLVAQFHLSGDRPLWVIERASLVTTAGQILPESWRLRDWVADSAGPGGFAIAEDVVGRVEFDSTCDWSKVEVRDARCVTTGFSSWFQWMHRGEWNPVVGASRTAGILHAWNGGDSVLRMGTGERSTVHAPSGVSVVLAERVSARVFDPGAAPGESRLVLADAHGGLWVEGEVPGTSVSGPRKGTPAVVTVRNGVLRLDVPRAGRVRVVVLDPGGRTTSVVLDRPLPAGIHLESFDRRAPGIVVVRLDGGVIGTTVLLPSR